MQVKRKYHYFYKITNNINGHFYYGVHNTDNLDDGYMGSGKRLHFAYKKYGMENFTKEILKFFDSSAEAFEYEAEVVNETLVSDPNCYNCINGGFNWSTKGLATVRDKDGNCFDVSVNDPRYLSGELKHVMSGLVVVKDINGKNIAISKNDHRYLSGELHGSTKGLFVAINDKGEKFYIKNDDPRYLSGELFGVTKGLFPAKDKQGRVYMVNSNDARILSGELVGIFYGRKHKDETKEKLKKSLKEIQHQQGEKNSQYGTCWIHNDKENKKIKKDELESYLSKGWIKGRKMKF